MCGLLFRASRKVLRERRNRDDRVARARCPPRAVEDDAVERLAILAAEERAVPPRRIAAAPKERRRTATSRLRS